MKRVAFLGSGGHTLPTYRALLNKLADHFELVVYAEAPLKNEWLALPHRYVLKSVKPALPRRVREFLFLMLVMKDHLKHPFDLIHAHSTYPNGFVAVLLQKLFRIPAIVSLNAAEASSLPDIGFGDLLHRKRTIMNRWVINHAEWVTVLSAFQTGEIRKNLGIERAITILPRGVDLNRFYFYRGNKVQTPVVFLSVGYLNPIKDPVMLIETFFQIQKELDSVLVVVGKDYTNGTISQLAQTLGIGEKVIFEGFVDHDAIHDYYRKADALLHTSRYESQGMVVAEAMASGVLVFGTHVGLMNDLSGECCMTVPTGNPTALAHEVLRLFKDQRGMKAMREKAYAWSVAHGLDHTCENVMDLYRQLVKSR